MEFAGFNPSTPVSIGLLGDEGQDLVVVLARVQSIHQVVQHALLGPHGGRTHGPGRKQGGCTLDTVVSRKLAPKSPNCRHVAACFHVLSYG